MKNTKCFFGKFMKHHQRIWQALSVYTDNALINNEEYQNHHS